MFRNIFTVIAVLFAACFLSIFSSQSSSLVMGKIYLKDGTVIECGKKDRMKIPKRSRNVRLRRNAYYRDKTIEVFKRNDIDSIIAWHPSTPEHTRKFVVSDRHKWMWVYFETPHIGTYIYSAKGYGIEGNGGIEIFKRVGTLFSTRTIYYLKKDGTDKFMSIGPTEPRFGKRFRRNVAEYINDDPVLAEEIRESKTSRNKTVLMLQDYNPDR